MCKRKSFFIPVLFVVSVLFYSCPLEKEIYKTIFVSDTAENRNVQIESLENLYVVVVLLANVPDMNTYRTKDIWDSPYSITKVKNGVINARLSSSIDYWSGSGKYWVVFFLPNNRGTSVSKAFISKEPHDFFEEMTRLSNSDFQPPLNVDMDFSEFLPF